MVVVLVLVVAEMSAGPETIEIGKLGDLKPLNPNARRRTQRSAGMIVQSLREVGAARSGVVDENLTILAGNGTAEALAEAGIERVKVVKADGNEWVVVKRTGLTEEQKRKLALYDNRTAELAEWDLEALLKEAEEIDVSGMWTDEELSALNETLSGIGAGEGGSSRQPKPIKVSITVPARAWLVDREHIQDLISGAVGEFGGEISWPD